MTSMTKGPSTTTEERLFQADRYRQAAYDLANAAKRLRDIGEALRATKVKVAEAAVADIAAAKAILADLPAVRVKGPSDRA